MSCAVFFFFGFVLFWFGFFFKKKERFLLEAPYLGISVFYGQARSYIYKVSITLFCSQRKEKKLLEIHVALNN